MICRLSLCKTYLAVQLRVVKHLIITYRLLYKLWKRQNDACHFQKGTNANVIKQATYKNARIWLLLAVPLHCLNCTWSPMHFLSCALICQRALLLRQYLGAMMKGCQGTCKSLLITYPDEWYFFFNLWRAEFTIVGYIQFMVHYTW